MDWDQLYREHQDAVFGFLYRKTSGNTDLARDLTQDVFVRALRSQHTFTDRGPGVLPWLFTIARNLVYDHYRSPRLQREALVEDIFDEWAPVTAGVDGEVLSHLDSAGVRSAVARLLPDQREAIVLQYWGDWSDDQISRRLNRRRGAVKTLKVRARGELRRRLGAVA